MLLPLLASAALASAPPSGFAETPPAVPAPATAAPAPPAAPAHAPSIESLLQSQGAGNDEDDAAQPAAPGPVPYSQLDGKAYDDAIRNAAAAARAEAGPLDGGWTLATADGHRMYRFQLADGGYQAQGAWRDLDGGPHLQGSGFIDQVAYSASQLTLRFYETDPGDQVLVTLKPSRSGAWSGQLLRHGQWIQVTFSRD